jgi:hypothetical protein
MESRYSDPNAWTPELGNVGWVYEGDRHVPAIERQAVVMMGFNPGAGRGATADKLAPGEKAWRTRCNRLTCGFCEKLVYAELITVASLNKKELRKSLIDFGAAFRDGATINGSIIAHHKPDIIFQAGLDAGDMALIGPLYKLHFMGKKPRPDHPSHDLLHHYEMGDDKTPWLAFIHFAARGFSNKDRDGIRDFAATILGERRAARPS